MSVHPGDTDIHDDASAAPTASPEAGDEARPFAEVPIRDYLTDVLAAVLLLVSLGLPWAIRDGAFLDAGEVPWVLPVTLVSLLSLSVFYLARFGALPATWTVQSTRKLRLLAALPYTIAVLTHLVLDGAGIGEYQGLGSAVAVGLAGAALAATPRVSELGPEDLDQAVSHFWWRIGAGLVLVVGLVMVAWAVLFSVEFFSESELSREMMGGLKVYALVVVEWLVISALVLAPAFQVLKGRSRDWRRVMTVLGATIVVVLYLGTTESGVGTLETLQASDGPATGAGLALVPALAAVLASPAITRRLKQQHPVTSWLMTANAALRYIAITSGALIVVTVLALFAEAPLGAGITAIVILLVLTVVSLMADKAMLKKVADGRRVALVVAGLSVILGIMLFSGDSTPSLLYWLGSEGHITWALLLITLGLPVLIAFALTVPNPIREFFATNKPSKSTSGVTAYEWREPAPAQVTPAPEVAHATPQLHAPQQSEPQQAGSQQESFVQAVDRSEGAAPGGNLAEKNTEPTADGVLGEGPFTAVDEPLPTHDQVSQPEVPAYETPVFNAPPHEEPTILPPAVDVTAPLDVSQLRSEFTPAVAADPATPAVTLAEIVEQVPELRPYVAVNPSTYPALLEWLGELGDPAVDEALRSRKR